MGNLLSGKKDLKQFQNIYHTQMFSQQIWLTLLDYLTYNIKYSSISIL